MKDLKVFNGRDTVSTVYLKFAMFMLWEASLLCCDFGTLHFVRLFCLGCYTIEERSMVLSRRIVTTVTHLFQTTFITPQGPMFWLGVMPTSY
jgi:hypothetical protein